MVVLRGGGVLMSEVPLYQGILILWVSTNFVSALAAGAWTNSAHKAAASCLRNAGSISLQGS